MRGLADTSIFIAQEGGRPVDVDRMPESLAVSVVTVAELRVGAAATDAESRARRLATLTGALALDPIPIEERVAEAWAGLRIRLRDAGLRMPVNDSWIAATAIAHDIPIVTQDADYVAMEGLEVIRI